MRKRKYSKLIGCIFFIAKQRSRILIFPNRAVLCWSYSSSFFKILFTPQISRLLPNFFKIPPLVTLYKSPLANAQLRPCITRIDVTFAYRIIEFWNFDYNRYHRLIQSIITGPSIAVIRGIYVGIVIVVRRPSGRATRAFRQTPASFFYFWPDPVVGIGEKTLAVRFSGVKGPARASRRFVDQVRLQCTYFSSYICIYVHTYIYIYMCVYVWVFVRVCVCVYVRIVYHFRFLIFVLLRYPNSK